MLNGQVEKKDRAEAVAKAGEAKPNEAGFQFQFNLQLLAWLEASQVSLGFTTYQIGKVFLVGRQPDTRRISIYERTFAQSMGLASSADGQQFAMGSLYQIWRFSNAVMQPLPAMRYDKVYIPQIGYITGECDAHDLGFDKEGKIVFANTLFNCIATMSETQSFVPIWKPPFISQLVPEDRCHLNGLGFRDGEPRYVTVCSRTDTKAGWREHRQNGGVVIDIQTNEVLCEGLSMPHSPRWHEDKLWVLNSGEGEFGYVDVNTKQFKPIALCEGFARGLSFHKNIAVIGLSKPRHNGTFEGLGLEQKLQAQQKTASVGLQLVDINTGQSILALWLNSDVKEIYDVTILPNTRTPMLLGFKNEEEIKRIIAFDQNALNRPLTKKKEQEKEEEIKNKDKEKLLQQNPAGESLLPEEVDVKADPISTSASPPRSLTATLNSAVTPPNDQKPLLSAGASQRLQALALFGAFAAAAVATGAWIGSKTLGDTAPEETADENMLRGCSIM